MSNDFIQNAVNNLYRDNELMALKAENARLKAENERLRNHRNTLIERLDNAIKDIDAKSAQCERLRIEVQKLTIALRTADRVIKPLRDAAAKEGKQS